MAVSSGAALTNPARHTRLDIARGRRQQRCAWGFPHEHGVRRWRGVGTHTAGADCALGCSDAAARRCSSRSLASVRRAATSLNSSLLCIVCSSMRASTTSATGSEDTSPSVSACGLGGNTTSYTPLQPGLPACSAVLSLCARSLAEFGCNVGSLVESRSRARYRQSHPPLRVRLVSGHMHWSPQLRETHTQACGKRHAG